QIPSFKSWSAFIDQQVPRLVYSLKDSFQHFVTFHVLDSDNNVSNVRHGALHGKLDNGLTLLPSLAPFIEIVTLDREERMPTSRLRIWLGTSCVDRRKHYARKVPFEHPFCVDSQDAVSPVAVGTSG